MQYYSHQITQTIP